jgi:8-oxo-dGTP pyrophosphatase MutT (NUDIX family)
VERERIRNYTHNELWCDFWVDKTMNAYREGYERSKKRYESIKYRIPYLLDSIQSSVLSPPWGFPKGRKNDNSEKEVECAIREFLEEIPIGGMSTIEVDITKRYFETHKGTNGKYYSTCCFPAEARQLFEPPVQILVDSIRSKTVSAEVGEIAWVDESDLKDYLSPGMIEMIVEMLEET